MFNSKIIELYKWSLNEGKVNSGYNYLSLGILFLILLVLFALYVLFLQYKKKYSKYSDNQLDYELKNISSQIKHFDIVFFMVFFGCINLHYLYGHTLLLEFLILTLIVVGIIVLLLNFQYIIYNSIKKARLQRTQ